MYSIRYIKSILSTITPGKILFPAEGEGRNAVYAAKLGWDVFAFDISEEGKKKAEMLALKNGVEINYQVGSFDDVLFDNHSFDVIALIYAHFHQDYRRVYHQKLTNYLKTGGYIILEAFSKKHIEYNAINPSIGGPKEPEMLYTMEELTDDFPNFEQLEMMEKEIELNEGLYHIGKGSSIRFLGRKK